MVGSIIVDSREQLPYQFDNSIRRKLDVGDYSIEGLETRIAIERKSLEDLVGTLLRGRRRFARELHALRAYSFAAVVIEGSIADILAGNYRSEMKPQALLAMLTAMMLKYTPVHWIFAGDRPHAYAVTTELLKFATERFTEEAHGTATTRDTTKAAAAAAA